MKFAIEGWRLTAGLAFFRSREEAEVTFGFALVYTRVDELWSVAMVLLCFTLCLERVLDTPR